MRTVVRYLTAQPSNSVLSKLLTCSILETGTRKAIVFVGSSYLGLAPEPCRVPTLGNHTHCQVAQKIRHTNQNLSKSMAAQSHGQTTENKALKHNTGIKHWGRSGYSNIGSRIKVCCTLIVKWPKSPTISYRHDLLTSVITIH